MELRKAGLQDVEALMALRKEQLRDEDRQEGNTFFQEPDIDEALRAYFSSSLAEGSMVEWVAEEEGRIVATSSIIFQAFPPSFTNPTGARGYVSNMYTVPSHRGQGIASSLLGKLREEAASRGVKLLWLGASPMGRPVYARFGFRDADTLMQMEL